MIPSGKYAPWEMSLPSGTFCIGRNNGHRQRRNNRKNIRIVISDAARKKMIARARKMKKMEISAEKDKKNKKMAVSMVFSKQNACSDDFYHLYIAPT